MAGVEAQPDLDKVAIGQAMVDTVNCQANEKAGALRVVDAVVALAITTGVLSPVLASSIRTPRPMLTMMMVKKQKCRGMLCSATEK